MLEFYYLFNFQSEVIGVGWGGRWEGGSGWGTHVHPWLIHVSVWKKPLQYCKVISLQLNKNKQNKHQKAKQNMKKNPNPNI